MHRLHGLRSGLPAGARRHVQHHRGTSGEPLRRATDVSSLRSVAVRGRLLNEFNLEIGAGLGDLAGKVWRIGLMGHASRAENIMLCIAALEAVLADMDAPINTGVALGAAQKVLVAK